MNVENVFVFANILFTIGTIRLFIQVFKNRDSLKDFDFFGSIITSNALGAMMIGYYYLEIINSILFAIPTLSFWIFISVYSGKQYFGLNRVKHNAVDN